jgi:hypothetical protein
MTGTDRKTAAAARCQPWVLMAAALLVGCKSDLNQQLLERELRYQEDQIYQLQDELQEKCARLERVAGENTSLRRQLGVADNDPAAAPRANPLRPRPAAAAPGLVPPAIEVPDLPRSPGSPASPAGSLAPPALDGVPPLPTRSDAGPAVREPARALPVSDGEPLALPPAAAVVDPAARPASGFVPAGDVRRLSFDASSAAATHLVVNADRTACLDGDGDGLSEGLKVVCEPRDAEERLVPAAGDVEIAVFDPGGGAGPVAQWRIPAAEAASAFRRTSRDRGLSFTLPWPALPPAGDHVRVAVRLVPPGGGPLEADATIRTR